MTSRKKRRARRGAGGGGAEEARFRGSFPALSPRDRGSKVLLYFTSPTTLPKISLPRPKWSTTRRTSR
eukprot:scaffold252133_cov24-Tisochrysis_lutea.AAC.1